MLVRWLVLGLLAGALIGIGGDDGLSGRTTLGLGSRADGLVSDASIYYARAVRLGGVVAPAPPPPVSGSGQGGGQAGAIPHQPVGDTEAVLGHPVARVAPVEPRPPSVPLQSGSAALICAAWTTWDCDEALLVFRGPTPNCPTGESGEDWRAVSPGGANWGGFQVNYEAHKDKLFRVTGSYDRELLLVPEVNVAVAHLVYVETGGGTWIPWACRPGLTLPVAGIGATP